MFLTDEQIKEAITSNSAHKVARCFDGSDYDRGYMEKVEATAEKTATGVSGLIVLLVERGIITEDDAFKILREAN